MRAKFSCAGVEVRCVFLRPHRLDVFGTLRSCAVKWIYFEAILSTLNWKFVEIMAPKRGPCEVKIGQNLTENGQNPLIFPGFQAKFAPKWRNFRRSAQIDPFLAVGKAVDRWKTTKFIIGSKKLSKLDQLWLLWRRNEVKIGQSPMIFEIFSDPNPPSGLVKNRISFWPYKRTQRDLGETPKMSLKLTRVLSNAHVFAPLSRLKV